jgi:hypothetical protein
MNIGIAALVSLILTCSLFIVSYIHWSLEIKSYWSDIPKVTYKNCSALEEKKGRFISSHGIMDGANYQFVLDRDGSKETMRSLPFIPRVFAPILRRYMLNPNCQLEGDVPVATVYVQTRMLNTFAKYSHNMDFPYVLLTGDDDNTVPQDVNALAYHYILRSPQLVKWHAQNLGLSERQLRGGDNAKHQGSGYESKLHLMPIGLDYHTLETHPEKVPHWGPGASVKKQEAQLLGVLKEAPRLSERLLKIYSTFHLNYLPDSATSFSDREEAFQDLPAELVDHEQKKITRLETWTKQATYGFVASPHGRGLDCHRTWEALVLGCIVIVKTSSLDPLYEGLPVLIVKEWKDVTSELLKETHAKYSAVVAPTSIEHALTTKALHLKYWRSVIAKQQHDS